MTTSDIVAKLWHKLSIVDSIEQQHLMRCGIGFIDAHLLAAAVIRDVPIWTKDKRLMAIANALYWSTKSTRHTETSAQHSMRNSVFKTNNSVLVQ